MMYNYDIIEGTRKDNLQFILFNKELFPFIENDNIFFRYKENIIFYKKVNDFGINDLCDVLGISIVDSVYVYYLLDIARENRYSMKSYSKKKSL